MAIYLERSGMFALSGPERRALELALEAALASPGSRTTRATVDRWRELREALR
jgi:hypothetical protein